MPMNLTRTLIIGNSGAGKSWLARRLAAHLDAPWIELDLIHWLSDEHSIPRPRGEAMGMARLAASQERWVIEGVYEVFVSELLDRATALIWLRIADAECVANIRQRERGSPPDDPRLAAMLAWAVGYRDREGTDGWAAHRQLFEGFAGEKVVLWERGEIIRFAGSA